MIRSTSGLYSGERVGSSSAPTVGHIITQNPARLVHRPNNVCGRPPHSHDPTRNVPPAALDPRTKTDRKAAAAAAITMTALPEAGARLVLPAVVEAAGVTNSAQGVAAMTASSRLVAMMAVIAAGREAPGTWAGSATLRAGGVAPGVAPAPAAAAAVMVVVVAGLATGAAEEEGLTVVTAEATWTEIAVGAAGVSATEWAVGAVVPGAAAVAMTVACGAAGPAEAAAVVVVMVSIAVTSAGVEAEGLTAAMTAGAAV